MQFSSSYSQPLPLSPSVQSRTYGLFAVAMAVTLLGVFLSMTFANALLTTGMHTFFAIAELALIFTAGWWVRHTPINMVLFLLFPLLSGITVTPYILLVLTGFTNGPAILLNAVGATVFVGLSATVLARVAPNLSAWGSALLYGLLGILFLTVLQLFVPALRTPGMELAISGGAIILFGLFTAFDIQRVQRLGAVGASPFLLALSLYLDIFNLFLAILRFMTALSGNRR